jgi:uncharacterized membrane protein HdeD (DUF308 family)
VSIFLKNRVTPWGWLLLQGILGILAGLYILRYPLVSTVLVPSLIVLLIGVQAIIIGVIRLIDAFRGSGWGMGILGVINIVLGGLLIGNPVVGGVVLPMVMGFFLIAGGVVAIIFGFQVK